MAIKPWKTVRCADEFRRLHGRDGGGGSIIDARLLTDKLQRTPRRALTDDVTLALLSPPTHADYLLYFVATLFVNCHHLGASTRSFVRPSLHGSRTSPLHRPTCVVGLSRVFCKFRTRRPGHVIAERKSRGFSGEWRFQFKWHAKGCERIKKKKNYAEKRREE